MKWLLCAATALLASPAMAQHDGHGETAQAQDHGAHQASSAPEPSGDLIVEHRLSGALGRYPISREASGTAWQPDASGGHGRHYVSGDWILMGHAVLNGVYDWQQGPRGDEQVFISGMVMGVARTGFGNGRLQLRAMLSPEPLNGRRGYPLHLAAGETADGATLLIDRQHPHDFFMELSASYSRDIGGDASLFVYAGLPGEPAFGPPAFMHRASIMASPEAPITHHWLDSTHISFGVVTAGFVLGDLKIEGSRFNGREPDHRRWNIETAPLDSTAVRLSWNPNAHLALQASWARLIAPEQLEPNETSTRWSASAIYTGDIAMYTKWSVTLAWGNRDGAEAVALEGAIAFDNWTIFGRAEIAENDELTFAGGHHGPRYTVGKASLGALREFEIGGGVRLGLGALYAMNFVPSALEALYAGDPDGAMLFIRLRIE
ncbi:MAG TPA: hypothetical protein VGO55_08170 [Allosphingosinicella sp.]|jgi:hypothetical protein|nr:hypothetical protein [Allosphingosinicella sp.]